MALPRLSDGSASDSGGAGVLSSPGSNAEGPARSRRTFRMLPTSELPRRWRHVSSHRSQHPYELASPLPVDVVDSAGTGPNDAVQRQLLRGVVERRISHTQRERSHRGHRRSRSANKTSQVYHEVHTQAPPLALVSPSTSGAAGNAHTSIVDMSHGHAEVYRTRNAAPLRISSTVPFLPSRRGVNSDSPLSMASRRPLSPRPEHASPSPWLKFQQMVPDHLFRRDQFHAGMSSQDWMTLLRAYRECVAHSATRPAQAFVQSSGKAQEHTVERVVSPSTAAVDARELPDVGKLAEAPAHDNDSTRSDTVSPPNDGAAAASDSVDTNPDQLRAEIARLQRELEFAREVANQQTEILIQENLKLMSQLDNLTSGNSEG